MSISRKDCGIITIAIGKKFIQYAKFLSISGMLNSPHTRRAVITDEVDSLKDYYDYVVEYDSSVSDIFKLKTKLYWYTPFETTMFVDSDSMFIYDVEPYLKECTSGICYYGRKVTDGEWYSVKIKDYLDTFALEWLPKMNTGMFIFSKDEESKKFFEKAEELFDQQKGFGIPSFRGTFMSDEPAIAISLARNNIEPVEDFGRYSRTVIGKIGKVKLNVQTRKCIYNKEGRNVFPAIIHFAGKLGDLLYFRERVRLYFAYNFNMGVGINNIIAQVAFAGFRISILLKRILKFRWKK